MTLQESELVPDEFDDPMQHQALAIDYFGEAYEAYLEGADAPFPDQLQILEDRYGACSRAVGGILFIIHPDSYQKRTDTVSARRRDLPVKHSKSRVSAT